MAIDTEDGDEEQVYFFQQFTAFIQNRHVTEKHHASVLAVNFSGMNASMHQQQGLVRP